MSVPIAPTAPRRPPAALWCAAATGVIAALLPPPGSDGRILHLPSFCVYQQLTGLPCPFCGLTRSFVCLAHGRWGEAIHYHPLGPAFAVGVALAGVDGLLRWRTGRGLPAPRRATGRLLWNVGAVLVAVVAVVRDVLVATHRFSM